MIGTNAGNRRPASTAGPGGRLRVLAVTAAAGFAVAACGSSTTSGASGPTSGAAGSSVITIKDFGFTTPASVAPGATITVRNQDSTAHTVTADSGNSFDDQAGTGNSTFTAPSKPGSYPFHCSIHPEMHGTLVVK